jgi:ATP-binding cassette, subfamily B, bacterial
MTDVLRSDPDAHRALRRAWPLVRPHRRWLGTAAVLSVLAALAELAGPVLIGWGVDALVDGDRAELARLSVAYGVVTVVLAMVHVARLRSAARAGEGFLAGVRDDVAERITHQPLAFFDRHASGELVARTTTDVAALAGFVRDGLPRLAETILLLVVTITVLGATSWPLALLTTLYLPGLTVAVRRFRRDSGPAYAAFAQAEATSTAAVTESAAGRSLLQGIGATSAWRDRVARTDRALLDANDAALRADNRLSVLGLWQHATIAVVVVTGGVLVDRGAATVGVVVTFALAMRQLFGPLDRLSWLYADAQRARASLARILDLLALPGGDRRPAAEPRPAPAHPTVELRDVSYTYDPPGRPAVDRLDLVIDAGERVAIVGPTGSGKSTLVKLATGLYAPTAGTVRIGGRLAEDWDPAELRRTVVLLPQEPHIIRGTVADNLRLVPGDHDELDLRAAIDRAGLRPWVAQLPDGLATTLTDRGANLSAGERQLVSLARAALADPAVLAMDEATADIDPATESLVNAAIDRLTAARTVIVVAHRPSTAARCDRQVHLVRGRLSALAAKASDD